MLIFVCNTPSKILEILTVMIRSKYTYLFESEGRYYIYNSLSNSLAKLDKDVYDEITTCRENNCFDFQDEDTMEMLKSMKVLVDNDMDEINKIKYVNLLRRNEPRRLILTINPTLACNFSCPYCFEGNHPNIYMTEKVEDDIVTFIKSNKEAKAVSVTWFGGEPLLAFDRMESLTRKIQALGLRYNADMITNGYLLSEDVISRLPSLGISSMQITIDGPARIHDSRRCLKSGAPTFDRIISNIDAVKRLQPDISVSVRVNVDKTNEKDFVELYRLFSDKHYKKFAVSLAFVKDISGCNTCSDFCNSREQAEFVLSLLRKYDLDFSYTYPLSSRYECAVRNRNAIVIGPEGELYKCWQDVGCKDKVVGYINGKVTNEPLLLRYLVGADPFEDPKCQECFLLPVCGGGCPYSRLQNVYEGKSVDTCLLIKDNLKDFLLAHAMHKSNAKNDAAVKCL